MQQASMGVARTPVLPRVAPARVTDRDLVVLIGREVHGALP
jgi:hypothetical protein